MTVLNLCLEKGFKPPLVYVDTRMEWNSSLPYVKKIAEIYGLDLHIAKSKQKPYEIFRYHLFIKLDCKNLLAVSTGIPRRRA